MTLYHYSSSLEVHFANGLLAGSSATNYPGYTAESASAGLGIPPPSFVYPVTFDPANTIVIGPMIVPPNRYGPGGLIEYYFPNGTPKGSVGLPSSVPSFRSRW